MADHDCIQQQEIGKIKEFMDSIKGVKASIFIMTITIAVQVGTFLFLWGGLTTTVTFHDKTLTKLEIQVDSLRYDKVKSTAMALSK